MKPTESLAAYDEFLKGEAASQGMKADQAGLRRAIGFYERAVSLDSAFAQAWSQLSRARTSLYSNGVPDPALGDAARVAAERARALRPDGSAGLSRRRRFLRQRQSDRQRARRGGVRARAPPRARRRGPARRVGDGRDRAGAVGWRAGAARPRLAARSALDSRRRAGWPPCSIFLRQYAAADSAVDRAIALAPTNSGRWRSLKVLVPLGRGDLAGGAARSSGRPPARIDAATLLPSSPPTRTCTGCWTTSSSGRCWRLPPSAFDDDRGVWGIVRTELYHLRGDRRPGRRLRRLGAPGHRGTEPGRTRRRAAPRAPRAGAGVPGTEGGGDSRGPARGRAAPDQPGRLPRALRPAPAGPDLCPDRGARAGARPARTAAAGAVLSLARLAPHRSDVRSAAEAAALSAARWQCGVDLPIMKRPVSSG